MSKTKNLTVFSLMLCFFIMGYVDLVGTASNYVKRDIGLTDFWANFLPSMVFLWFLILSVPTSMLMSRIGRKNTVLLSLVVTLLALLLPIFGETFMLMVVSFSLLGIGNTLLQTSLNPLVAEVIGGEQLASTLTFGQFVKAIASFMAPYIAIWGSTQVIPSLGLGWRVLFPIYLIIGIITTLLLYGSHIVEKPVEGEPSTFVECFQLLGKPIVLLSFLGIICHVGIDVGINTTAPRIFIERLGVGIDVAAKAASIYFLFRVIGCLLGSALLRVMNHRLFFVLSVLCLALAMIGFCVGQSAPVLYVAVALGGLGNSNVFSLVLSQALLSVPDKQNEVSGLMIMGLFGGTIFPLLMGAASDAIGQVGAVLVMAVGVLYLAAYIPQVKH